MFCIAKFVQITPNRPTPVLRQDTSILKPDRILVLVAVTAQLAHWTRPGEIPHLEHKRWPTQKSSVTLPHCEPRTCGRYYLAFPSRFRSFSCAAPNSFHSTAVVLCPLSRLPLSRARPPVVNSIACPDVGFSSLRTDTLVDKSRDQPVRSVAHNGSHHRRCRQWLERHDWKARGSCRGTGRSSHWIGEFVVELHGREDAYHPHGPSWGRYVVALCIRESIRPLTSWLLTHRQGHSGSQNQGEVLHLSLGTYSLGTHTPLVFQFVGAVDINLRRT